jgi:Fe-S-cluster containining protein
MRVPRRRTASQPKVATRTEPACEGCPAFCCHDLVMPVLKPRTRTDIEELKWKLQYDAVSVFISNCRWHLQVKARCIYLTDKHLCSIYERRPDRCRDHSPSDCERYGSYFDVRIDTPEELDAYLASEKRRRRRARAGRRRGTGARRS